MSLLGNFRGRHQLAVPPSERESATERGTDRPALVGLDNTEAANLASPADHYRQVCQLSRGTCAETLIIAYGPLAPFDRIRLQD